MNDKLTSKIKAFVSKMNQELVLLYLVSKDRRTPLGVKILAVCVVAYALSPIDLIPDFIPVLGYLDDIIIVPLGIALCLKLIPDEVLESNRAQAQMINKRSLSKNWYAGILIITLWIIVMTLIGLWIYQNWIR